MSAVQQRFWHSFVAVIAGNALYFSLERYLPPRARHTPYQLDWGLAVDFWLCLVCYGLVGMLKVFRKRGPGRDDRR